MAAALNSLLTLDEARALVVGEVEPLAGERLPIAECLGRVLAEDVVATRDQPPENLSSMDGYAIGGPSGDHPGATFRVIGTAPAGAPFGGLVGQGEAVRIATGGVLPKGADRVVIQEEVEIDGSAIMLRIGGTSPPYVRQAGSDFEAGQTVASAGEILTPARLALVASANRDSVDVTTRPSIIIVSSGDELREPGTTLERGSVVNSAAYAIQALAAEWGGASERLPIFPDEPGSCEAQIRSGHLAADVIVTLGGASVGDRDVLRPTFEKLGAAIVFAGMNVVPGKPSWFARFPNGRRVLGLPGNPASAFVCAQLLLRPLLFALTGRRGAMMRLDTAALAAPLPANGSREAFLRGRAMIDGVGRLVVTPADRQDSGMLTPLAMANALIRRAPAALAATPGEPVKLLLVGAL